MDSSAINVGRLKLTEYKLLVDSNHIYRSETPVSELVELSDLFLQNFRHPPPPISTLSQHTSVSDPIILLCRCNSRSIKPMSDLIRNTAFSPLHTPRIKALWPLFWRWVQDLFLHPLEKENLSPLVLTTLFQSGIHESRESTFTTCSGFLDALKGPDPGLVIEMPGFISSYLYWWRFSSLQPGNPDASPVLLQYLCNMFQRLYGFMPSYSSIERELGPASDFVTSALGSIRVTMDQETLINGIRRFDNFDLGQALHVMQYHPSSMMHAEFVRQGSIELVVDILKTLPTRALRESPEIQTFIISTIFQYLVKVYSLPHGKDHIQRAIECDIILALCDIAQRGHLRDPSAEFTKAAIQLFKILYSQIPFSHNLRIARKSIRPITLSEVSIVNHWSLIVSLVRYISPLQHTYKLTTGKVCNVCGCESEPSKSLRKCARCGVRYCSRTCQRSDWDAVHRKLCPPEMAAHQPDGRWLTSINTDILKRSKEKITLLFQKYALINEQADRPPHVAISVNYFAHPITISSETIDEEYSENTKPEASLTDLLDVTTVIPMNASDNTVLKVELEQNLCPEPPYYTREEFLEQSVGDDDDLMKIRAEITRIEDILGETATQAGAGIPIVFEDSGDWDTGDISH